MHITANAKVFELERNKNFNGNISLFRYSLALFVLFVHIVPWFSSHAGLAVNAFLVDLASLIGKIFQSSGETNPAVLAFITLSGYCIHRNGIRTDSFNLKTFFVRRFYRIVPLFIVGLTMGVVAFLIFGNDSLTKSITSTQNLSFSGVMTKMFGLHSIFPHFYTSSFQGNGPLATVAVEMYLYMLYPFISFFMLKNGCKAFFWTLVSIVFLGDLACYLIPSLKGWWHNGSLLGFIAYWWLGVCGVDKSFFVYKNKKVLFLIFLFLTFFLYCFPNLFLLVEIKKMNFCLLVLIVIRYLEEQKKDTRPNLIPKAFWESGYSLYAIHAPLSVVCLGLDISLLSTVVLIISFSFLFYICIERPFIRKGKKSLHKSIVCA